MSLEHLQHYLIKAAGLEETKDWPVGVVAPEVGPYPDFPPPVCRPYLNGRDVPRPATGGSDVGKNRK